MRCSTSGGAARTTQHSLENQTSTLRARYDFAGATAAIALPDGTVVTAAPGMADKEAGRAMLPTSRMLAASTGKSLVAATVLSLESDGLISRTDLVSDHIGDAD